MNDNAPHYNQRPSTAEKKEAADVNAASVAERSRLATGKVAKAKAETEAQFQGKVE